MGGLEVQPEAAVEDNIANEEVDEDHMARMMIHVARMMIHVARMMIHVARMMWTARHRWQAMAATAAPVLLTRPAVEAPRAAAAEAAAEAAAGAAAGAARRQGARQGAARASPAGSEGSNASSSAVATCKIYCMDCCNPSDSRPMNFHAHCWKQWHGMRHEAI